MANDRLAIGICCYPTYGGSGTIATEVGMAMAKRGHRVHIISYDVPYRLNRFMENIYFHEVEVTSYPLFTYPPYDLALASKLVEVADQHRLQVLHAHYAIPHAVSAVLAKQILKDRPPKVITTLHGTDITLVGNDRNYLPITRFSILQSDQVTVVSQFLREATYDKLNVPTDTSIEVIPNFVNFEQFHIDRGRCDQIRSHFADGICLKNKPVICHVSNFRPVKRIDDVVRAFKIIRNSLDAFLLLVGDGPERSRIEGMCRDEGLTDSVCFLGKQESVQDILPCCDLFFLPSQTESFGLAALEAMACEVPVIATKVGGLPEVIDHGVTGYLCEVGNVQQMADFAVALLRDPAARKRMGQAARKIAQERYSLEKIMDQYEACYRRVVQKES
jgi:N-acetyl-alpha-D-glucosaminyl L-malate synthase BshA